LVSPATIVTPARLAARRHGLDLVREHPCVEPLLEDERRRQPQRPRADHRQVIDRAVDRQLTDRTAGEADRLHHERVGGQRQARVVETECCAVRGHVAKHRGVPKPRQRRVLQRGDDQPLDELT
jgi:hypothetical protein